MCATASSRRWSTSLADPKIFVFRIGQLGDSLVALPALMKLAERYPGGDYTLITNAPERSTFVTAWEVMQHTGLFSDRIAYDPTSLSSIRALAGELSRRRGDNLLCYLGPLYRTRFQVARDQVFFRACGFNRIIGLESARSPELRSAGGLLHTLAKESTRLLDVVADATFGSKTPPPPPLLWPPPESERKVDALLAPLREPIVGLGPGSKMPAKKWFFDRFETLVDRIIEHGASLAVLGGPEDRDDGEALARRHPEHVVNLAGHTSIIESAAALGRCAVYVGNDTGTMHLAAAMGTRCVAIFTSRANPGMWEPWGEGHATLRRELDCSGCMLVECVEQKMRCLDLIAVDDVWQRVASALR